MKKPIVFTIDDDVDFNNFLKLTLKPLDLDLKICTTVDQFTALMRSSTPDLCIIDLNLDIAMGAGYKLIQAIRLTKDHDIPIIVISRRNSTKDISLALEVGANDALTKPLDPPLLISKIKQHLQLEGKKNELTFYSISEVKQECHLSFHLHLNQISEYGITLSSPHLISKGTLINLKSSALKEILNMDEISLMVDETSFNTDLKLFYAFCEFDATKPEISLQARQWILRQPV